MGMFDNIRFETECPNCKGKVNGFQSKSGECGMYLLEFWEVNNFYSSCPQCSTWIDYTIKQRPNRRLTIDDYHKEVKIPSKKEQEEYKKGLETLAKMLKKQDKEVEENEKENK